MTSPLTPSAGLPEAVLTIEPPSDLGGDQVEFACRLESREERRRVWFRFPTATAVALTRRADPFVIATLRHAMGRFARVRVEGEVSAGLLPSLADFQGAYAACNRWRLTQPVDYTAAECRTPLARSEGPAGVTAFSGGVDSCFSVYRHAPFSPLTPKRTVRGALMMHGFDIPLEERDGFGRAAARARAVVEDAGLVFHAGATNLRALPEPWEDSFATAVAASLAFFQPVYAFGLVPSFQDWAHLHLDHGSNPLTDPLLSSLAFPVIHDGTGFGRIQKLAHLTHWPAALRGLRVCWEGRDYDRNCGFCEKCLRTILMLRLCGVSRCEAFPDGLDLAALERLRIETEGGLYEFAYLLREARRRGVEEPWVAAAGRALARGERRRRLRQHGRTLASYLPPAVRDAVRGASRRWLARRPATSVRAGEANRSDPPPRP